MFSCHRIYPRFSRSISSFGKVDKTQQAHALITQGAGRYCFVAPEGFGKSFLLSTLEQIFSGHQHLFQRSWIGSSDYQWKKYPMIKLDCSKLEKNRLTDSFLVELNRIAGEYGHTLQKTTSIMDTTQELITKLSNEGTKKVVVLVDNYDSPVVEHFEDVQKAKENLSILKRFFAVVKSRDDYVKFIFVTGAIRVPHGMNLDDISMESGYGVLAGYTDEEIKRDLSESVQEVAKKTARTFDDVVKEMREWYNGYRFSTDSLPVYRP